MTYYIKIIASALLILLIASCSKDLKKIVSEQGHSFEESIELWNDLKKNNSNSYKYTSTFTSAFGFGSSTEITVTDGKVAERSYKEFAVDPSTGELTESDTNNYTEASSEIGTNQIGFAPLTIDELYDSCSGEYLKVSESENIIYFETEPNGLINLCGYFPNTCADDCFIGFNIKSFEFL